MVSRRRTELIVFGLTYALSCFFILSTSVDAQSLDPNSPGPLKPGINSSTADSTVGTQYWYYIAESGTHTVKVTFQSMGVLGAPMRNTLVITLSSPLGSEKKSVTSQNEQQSITFSGKMLKSAKMVIRVDPLSPTGLIRQGGDYQIQVTGAVKFPGDSNLSSTGGTVPNQEGAFTAQKDPICRAYVSMLNNWGITKFLPDGTVCASDGTVGTWKLEDLDTQSYTVILRDCHLSLIYMPGRGLVDANDKSMVTFKQMR